MTTQKFQRLILTHYRKQGRKNLPWKKTRDSYKILVSEVMLQQTQVSRVLPKYREFLRSFPSLKNLAAAPNAKLLRVWQGLGYWRRARYLKLAAQAIVKNYEGKFPRDPKTLKTLPGVGPCTAGAVACFAFGSKEPFIDTNIRRVYLHFFFQKKKNVADKDILKIAQRTLYRKDPRTWHYALFDYGATVLKDRSINRRSKHYTKQSQFTGSFRSFRAHVMSLLLKNSCHSLPKEKVTRSLESFLQASNSQFKAGEILKSLTKDNLIKQKTARYYL